MATGSHIGTMTQGEFRRALKRLDLNHTQAARKLGTNLFAISRWAHGHRPVPPYIAAHVQTLLDTTSQPVEAQG